jgi:hypothetical protein
MSIGKSATESIDIAFGGYGEREKHATYVQSFSVSETKTLLEQPILDQKYCVDTVGLAEYLIRNRLEYQEKQERRQEQINLEK